MNGGDRDSQALTPLSAVTVGLVILVVGGGFLLLSARESPPIDGAVEWGQESPLRAVVQLLCLNYRFPTLNAGDVKGYLLGLGAGLSLMALAVASLSRTPGAGGDDSDISASLAAGNGFPAGGVGVGPAASSWARLLHPWVGALAATGLYLLWSFASCRWSPAPDMALGGSLLLAIQLLWSAGLALGLTRRAACIAARAVITITGITALVALWYYYGRNWTLRAKFPFGNPNFLSACLIPGILLAISEIVGTVERGRAHGSTFRPHLWGAAAAAVACAAAIWAFVLSESRGPALGLVVGMIALAFFGLRGRKRLVTAVVCVLLVGAAGLYFWARQNTASVTGRDVTIRFRTYAWKYAWHMFLERPLTGHGQGGFVLKGDSYAAADVLSDPLAFEARVDHAHNEWLEVMADLGAAGMVLLVVALLLTFRVGLASLRGPPTPQRWTQIGLLSALAGLAASDTVGVGLRVCEVPLAFYTLWGLVWAASRPVGFDALAALSRTRAARLATGALAGSASLVVLVLNQQDFAAARRAFRAEMHLEAQEFPQAAELADGSGSRLNPQRALTDLYRLAEAHTLTAQSLLLQAMDREARARQVERMDPQHQQLLLLAAQDREQSEAHSATATSALKALVARSPGFLNHGRLEYRLRMLEAQRAAGERNGSAQALAQRNALAALERELRRQPFEPDLALEYVQAAGTGIPPDRALEIVARPLRHNPITLEYLQLLAGRDTASDFAAAFERAVAEAKEAWAAHAAPEAAGREAWHPEKMRLAAALTFARGDYAEAQALLESAAAAYAPLERSAGMGAASCHAELADCCFFRTPADPRPALTAARRAVDLAPQSLPGRQLVARVKQRMVDYLLAADDEPQAEQLLRESAPPGIRAEVVQRQLAVRYRALAESLLRRREGPLFRKPPAELVPALRRWVARAIEYDPGDYAAHYLAADLAFHAGDDGAAAEHLRRALENGLSVEEAKKFLEVAREMRPDSAPMQALWDLVDKE
ncbi:MAG: O-antigen ligase family protein [Planctomycetes bacterium]|nr:O-antigen ligase family protein [Planctomycetota bacterium]